MKYVVIAGTTLTVCAVMNLMIAYESKKKKQNETNKETIHRNQGCNIHRTDSAPDNDVEDSIRTLTTEPDNETIK